MEETFFEDLSLEKEDFTHKSLPKGEYENCKFSNCNFSNSDLSGIHFIDCCFDNCNLSMALIKQTGFQNVAFKNCKMLGMSFDKSSDFGFQINIDTCQLNYSSFFKKNLAKTNFTASKFHEVDFTECNLSNSIFKDCDLHLATFKQCNLQKVDFRSTVNFTIDPEMNKINGAKFTLETIKGLLTSYNIVIDSD